MKASKSKRRTAKMPYFISPDAAKSYKQLGNLTLELAQNAGSALA